MKANNDLLDIVYYIKNNDDWKTMNTGERIVDINNDAYFGFRAMEKEALNIKYDPCIIDSLVRVVKEGKKFPNTKHILIIDEDTLDYKAKENLENFLKIATRKIEEIISINNDIKLKFHIKRNNGDETKVLNILNEIYKNYL